MAGRSKHFSFFPVSVQTNKISIEMASASLQLYPKMKQMKVTKSSFEIHPSSEGAFLAE